VNRGKTIIKNQMMLLCVISLMLANCGGETQDGRAGKVLTPGVSDLSQLDKTQDVTGLRIVPISNRLDVTEAGAVEIRMDNATDLYGLHLSLDFNPAMLQVQDTDPAQDGVQIAPGMLPAPDFTVLNTVDNDQGTIEYAVTQLNPREPAQGNGVVAVIRFQGVGAGISPLMFSYAKLANPDGQEMPIHIANATLEVN
jgi:hypothetical protein